LRSVGEFDAVVIGAGFSGLYMLHRLRDTLRLSARVFEAADDVGCTWYWNRYPGAMCDVESYIYMPLLEETGYIPKEKYSFAPEICEHSQRVGRHYGLYEQAIFQTRVLKLEWDASIARWRASRYPSSVPRPSAAFTVITGRSDSNRIRPSSVSSAGCESPARAHT